MPERKPEVVPEWVLQSDGENVPDAHSVGEALAVEDCDRDAVPVAHTLALKVAVLQSEADTVIETESVPEAELHEDKEGDTEVL